MKKKRIFLPLASHKISVRGQLLKEGGKGEGAALAVARPQLGRCHKALGTHVEKRGTSILDSAITLLSPQGTPGLVAANLGRLKATKTCPLLTRRSPRHCCFSECFG